MLESLISCYSQDFQVVSIPEIRPPLSLLLVRHRDHPEHASSVGSVRSSPILARSRTRDESHPLRSHDNVVVGSCFGNVERLASFCEKFIVNVLDLSKRSVV